MNRPTFAAAILSIATAAAGCSSSASPPSTTIGVPVRLQSVVVTFGEPEYRKVEILEGPIEDPALVVPFTIENVNESKVVGMFTLASGVDEFGNETPNLAKASRLIEDERRFADLKPGESGRSFAVLAVPLTKATAFKVTLRVQDDNTGRDADYRPVVLHLKASEVKGYPAAGR